MTADDMLDDGEPEPRPSHRPAAAGVDTIESLGEARQMLGRDAFAPVDHAHADHVRTRAFEPHCHILAVATIFEGVDDEVLDQLQELRAVAGDDGFAIVLFDNDSDRKSTRLNSSHYCASRMPSSALKK